jgi:hypothetical protein
MGITSDRTIDTTSNPPPRMMRFLLKGDNRLNALAALDGSSAVTTGNWGGVGVTAYGGDGWLEERRSFI